jgi:hypothetical protein
MWPDSQRKKSTMRRPARYAALTLASVAWLGGCVEPPSWFPFEARRTPRMFVHHVPLVPEPGGSMNLLASVDGLSADQIAEVRARLELPGGDGLAQTCTAIGSSTNYNCAFDLDEVADGSELIVRASATPAAGVEGPSLLRADPFRMTVRSLRDEDAPQLITVREPLAPRQVLEGTGFAIKTVLVRDASEGFTPHSFRAAAHSLIHEAIFDDPVYRWRSNQFAFYLYTRPAATSDYYSGKDTRCGQNPFPQLSALPAAIEGMDAIGVLHRRSGPGADFGTAPPT